MPINAHPDYLNAEKKYHEAQTDDEKIKALEEMIRHAPKHKGGETLRKNLRTRYKKLKQESAQKRKKGKTKKGIKKEQLQATLIGLTNSGKSSIMKAITNKNPKIASYGFTTQEPEQGILNYEGVSIQIIDTPPIASENFNQGIVNTADTLIIVVEKIDEIQEVLKTISNKDAKKIVLFNKIDLYDEKTQRKISENLKSKKHNFILTSTKSDQGLEELKEKILKSFNIIRVYTRQPGKKHDEVPTILLPNSTIKDAAEKILHGYSKKVKFAKIFGPSAKFQGQKTGLKHVLKDKDIIELYTD